MVNSSDEQTHRDKMWMACLDDALSASEAADFDKTLTGAERDRLAAERRLESAIADKLGEAAPCPDARASPSTSGSVRDRTICPASPIRAHGGRGGADRVRAVGDPVIREVVSVTRWSADRSVGDFINSANKCARYSRAGAGGV